MPPTRDEEEELVEAVREAHKRVKESKGRADRLTNHLLEGNERQAEFLESMRQANKALGGR